MTRRAVLAASFLFAVAACQAPPPPEPEFTDADRQAIADEITRLSSEMWAIGEPERFEEMMAFWADGAEGFFVGEPALFNQGVRVISTMEDMLSFSEGFVGGRTRTNFFPQENYVAVYSPTLAVQVTQQHFSVTNNDGETGSTFPMSSTTLWVLEEGAWKIAHHHQSWTNDPVEEEEEG